MDQLTSVQLSEWEAYSRIDPIGSWREDFRVAQLQSLIMNIVNVLYSKKGIKPEITSPIDFMPDWSGDNVKEPEKMSMEEMERRLLSIANIQNKKVDRQNRIPSKKINKEKP